MTLVDVELRDGSTVRVRPVTAADAEALAAFLRELSPDDRRYRFFGTVDPEAAARAMAAATGSDDHGLVALSGVPERVVAHAQYSRPPGGTVAEVAFAVADALQGRGLGTLLLAHLAEHAHAAGVELLDAHVMADNRRMLDVFRRSGFPTIIRNEAGARYVRFPASLSPAAMEIFEARQRTAAEAVVRRRARAGLGGRRRRLPRTRDRGRRGAAPPARRRLHGPPVRGQPLRGRGPGHARPRPGRRPARAGRPRGDRGAEGRRPGRRPRVR